MAENKTDEEYLKEFNRRFDVSNAVAKTVSSISHAITKTYDVNAKNVLKNTLAQIQSFPTVKDIERKARQTDIRTLRDKITDTESNLETLDWLKTHLSNIFIYLENFKKFLANSKINIRKITMPRLRLLLKTLGSEQTKLGEVEDRLRHIKSINITALNIMLTNIGSINEQMLGLRNTTNELIAGKTGLAVMYNQRIDQLLILISKCSELRSEAVKELLVTYDTTAHVIGTLRSDVDFLESLDKLKLSTILPSGIIKPENKVSAFDDPFYIEAESNKTFYKPVVYREYGILQPEQSTKRIFEQKPIFDNTKCYDMNSNINHLMQQYFSDDSLIEDYSGYLDELTELAKKSPKLDKSIRGVIIIPAYQEAKIITKTLKFYERAYIEGKVAIFILENLPVGKGRDGTLAKIQLFRYNNPKIKVYHVFKQFKERVPIGCIRKYITDYILLLKFYSKHPGNLILINGDADVEELSPDYIRGILNTFEKLPYLDAIESKMDFPRKYMLKYPNLWVMHRLFDFSWKFMRHKITPHKALRLYGPASSIKASSYLMINGYNPRTRLCEDLELSWLLDEARRSADPKKTYFKFLPYRIVVNPRRAISAYLSQVSFLDMYEGFEEKEGIRQLGWEELVDKADSTLDVGSIYSEKEIRDAIEFTQHTEKKRHKLATSLAYGLQKYIDWWQFKVEKRKWMHPEDFENMLSRVMAWIGIGYDLRFSHPHWTIKILNVGKLLENMNKIIEQEGSTFRRIYPINYQIQKAA